MHLQCTVLNERLPAALADMCSLSCVDLLVSPECSSSGKTFGTDDTSVWFDACVAPHVCLHVLEAFSANGADATTHSVRLEVCQQMVCRVHLLTTDPTDTWRCPEVDFSMFPQETFTVE